MGGYDPKTDCFSTPAVVWALVTFFAVVMIGVGLQLLMIW